MDIETCRRIYKDSRDGRMLPVEFVTALLVGQAASGIRKAIIPRWVDYRTQEEERADIREIQEAGYNVIVFPDHMEVSYDVPGVAEDKDLLSRVD